MAAAPITMRTALRGVKRAYLDASVFIDYGVAAVRSVTQLKELFTQIQSGRVKAIISTVVLPEILAIDPTDALHTGYQELLRLTRIVPLSEEIAREAARIRFTYRLLTPDAIHVATASQAGCQALITADAQDLERTGGLPLSGGAGYLRVIIPQRLSR